MKIKKVEPFIVQSKLEKSFYFSQWEYDKRVICLVKITADDGTYGWGEGYGPAHLIKAGVEFFTQIIINEDPMHSELLWQKMYRRSLDYARKGILVSALSAIDVALWDLKGKLLNLPVSVLLGGRKREYVKPYATGMYFSKGNHLTQKLVDEALVYKNAGYEAMKMKVGLGIKKDIENVKAVREAIGPDIELMIDANHAFSLKEAVQLAYALEEINIGWFEEPVSPDHYECYAELRQKTSIPIAGGECEYLCGGFLHLFQKRCVDIAQPDICSAGGLTEVKKIACLAQAFGVEFVPHTWGTSIALSAALQLLSNSDVVPGRLYEPDLFLEFDRTENPLRDELVTPQFSLENGKINVPDKPGLGIDVDEKALQHYSI